MVGIPTISLVKDIFLVALSSSPFVKKKSLMSALSGLDRNAKNHLAVLSFLVNEGRPLLS